MCSSFCSKKYPPTKRRIGRKNEHKRATHLFDFFGKLISGTFFESMLYLFYSEKGAKNKPVPIFGLIGRPQTTKPSQEDY
jgi:hypothetical protein